MKEIQNLSTKAHVFRSKDGSNHHPFDPTFIDRGAQPPREIYLFSLKDSVSTVTFENYDQLEKDFIDEFLSRLELTIEA